MLPFNCTDHNHSGFREIITLAFIFLGFLPVSSALQVFTLPLSNDHSAPSNELTLVLRASLNSPILAKIYLQASSNISKFSISPF